MINFAHPIVVVLVAAALMGGVVVSVRSLDSLFDRAGRGADSIARPSLALIAIVFCFALVAAIWPSLVWGVPVPNVHDEFAYLLAGDTFARGRLTNPPHAMAEFLETFHVIQSPTYAAKFPIGQGVAIALGIVLGLPILGVWLSTAAGCAAVAWAVRAIVPPRWALLAGMLVALHPLVEWWSGSYWGGGVAMLGGAVFTGAALRTMRSSTVNARHGVLMGAGLAILANSRPLEGALLGAIVLIALFVHVVRNRKAARWLSRGALPMAGVLAACATLMGYYNWRVTGEPSRMPYLVHAQQYMASPLLYWQDAPTPTYRHAEIGRFFLGRELAEFRDQQNVLATMPVKWRTLLANYVNPPTLAIPLLVAAATAFRRRAAWIALLVCVLVPTLHMTITPWLRPAYMAPLMALLMLAVIVGLRELSALGSRARAIVLLVIIAQSVAAIAHAKSLSGLGHAPVAVERQRLIEQLTRAGGKHLIIVRYGPGYDPFFEFVFNRADIDGSPVVFARSMGDAKDRELLSYFHDRKAWDLYFAEGEFRVTPR